MMNKPPEPATNFCDKARELAIAVLEGDALNELDSAFLDKHLEVCPDCQAYQHTMGNLLASFEEIPEALVPAGLSDRIMAQVAQIAETEAPGTAKVAHARFGWRKSAPVAAAVLLLALAIPFVTSRFSGQSGSSGQPTVAQLPVQQIAAPVTTEATETPAEEMVAVASSDKPGVKSLPVKTFAAAPPKPAHAVAPSVATRHSATSVGISPEDSMTLASASPANGLDLQNAFANQSEEDDYYDPVSSLVGY